MKLCSRLLMVFGQNFCEKQQIWVSEPHFGKVRGDAWLWLMTRSKANGQIFIRINWTFSLSITVPELWGKMCTAWLFSQGGRPLCIQILPGQDHPHQPFLATENYRDWVIWRWRPHPSAFPHFDIIPECDGQTDG